MGFDNEQYPIPDGFELNERDKILGQLNALRGEHGQPLFTVRRVAVYEGFLLQGILKALGHGQHLEGWLHRDLEG